MLKLGTTGPEVFPIGLGCQRFSGGFAATDDAESIATIQAAIDAGITLLDTGDFYGMGHNEQLVGKAIAERRDRVQLSVKFGGQRAPDGTFVGIDARPASVKNFASYSLKRLGVDVIDIYRPARLDRSVPIEDTVGAIADLIKAGYVKHIGLSEMGAGTVRRAHATHPIVDLQIGYALSTREPEAQIFPALDELGISATLYGVLGHGLLGGSKAEAGDARAHLPRFAAENRATNDAVVATLRRFAEARGMTSAQLAIAWAIAKQPRFVTLVGVRNRAQLASALGALDHALTAPDVAELEAAVPESAFAGERYAPALMKFLDRET